jgi:hypothetical protein
LSTDERQAGAAIETGAVLHAEIPTRRWSWGAFVFTWVWGVFNGAWWTLLGLVLTLVPSVDLWRQALPGGGSAWVSTATLLYTAWSVVCGLYGERWAARGRRWQSAEQFRRRQHAWAVAALVVAIVLAVVVAADLALAAAGVIQ